MTHYQKVAEAIESLNGIYFEHSSERLEAIANLLEKEFPDKPVLKLDCETVPPSIEQVLDQSRLIELNEREAKRFHAYYESNGWRVGRNKMKSWKAALCGWKLRNDLKGADNGSGNGHLTDAQMIAMTKERERIAERLKELRGQGSRDSWGVRFTPSQLAEIKRLKTRDNELKGLLHVIV